MSKTKWYRTAAALAGERLQMLRLLTSASQADLAALIIAQLVLVATAGAYPVLVGLLARSASSPQAAGLAWLVAVFALCLLLDQCASVARDVSLVRTGRQIDLRSASRVRSRIYLSDRPAAYAARNVGTAVSIACQPDLSVGYSAGSAATGAFAIVGRYAAAVFPAVVLWRAGPALAVIVVVIALSLRITGRRQFVNLARASAEAPSRTRRIAELERLIWDERSARESSVFEWRRWVIPAWKTEASASRNATSAGKRRVLRLQSVSVLAIVAVGLLTVVLETASGSALSNREANLLRAITAVLGVLQLSFWGRETFDVEHGREGFRALSAAMAVDAGAGSSADRDRRRTPPEVHFEKVSFAYEGVSVATLRDVSLDLLPGSITALVGANGAGKSTLLRLLCGLDPASSGHVLVDGERFEQIPKAIWRASIASVSQDFIRYPLTLRENITLTSRRSPKIDDQVMTAVRRAGLFDFVADLPSGLDTDLWQSGASSVTPSGGQWQRVALARALFAVSSGCSLLILDEPTAMMDLRTERSILTALREVAPQTTTLIVTHHLSTVTDADQIVVLENGEVVEMGRHETLMRADGVYAAMFRSQAKAVGNERTS